MRSVPAIADEVKVVNGQLVKVQNVAVLPLTNSIDFIHYEYFDSDTAAWFYFVNTGYDWIKVNANTISYDKLLKPDNAANMKNIGYITSSNNMNFIISFELLGTDYATYNALSSASKTQFLKDWFDAQQINLYYQLATPIITPPLSPPASSKPSREQCTLNPTTKAHTRRSLKSPCPTKARLTSSLV